uniref:non-specific serine/threonine protein kinase n=1 Tax=Amphiprion percula TaxID=161767 RepID=A0A3P8S9T5_AMPPE
MHTKAGFQSRQHAKDCCLRLLSQHFVLIELTNPQPPLCKALQYLHNMDVAHRDLKCENLLLDRHCNLKVCDFGFSKRLSYVDDQMALSETYCGTSSYAAPEILKNFPYNPKVSNVGVVLYMMLYASVPFNDSNITRMVKKQMEHRINFPKIPPVSFEAKDLINGILHPVVEQRITIGEILENSWILQEGKMEDSNEDRWALCNMHCLKHLLSLQVKQLNTLTDKRF